jgi:bifunctional non-homologous end joining protein LigD
MTFLLQGKRLKGRWHLVRLRGKRSSDAKQQNWLLIKAPDEYANARGDAAIENFQKSVASGRSMEGIARGARQNRRGHAARSKSVARTKSGAGATKALKVLKKK